MAWPSEKRLETAPESWIAQPRTHRLEPLGLGDRTLTNDEEYTGTRIDVICEGHVTLQFRCGPRLIFKPILCFPTIYIAKISFLIQSR